MGRRLADASASSATPSGRTGKEQDDNERGERGPGVRPVRRTFDLGRRRPVIVTVYESGVVEFREKYRRKVYAAHLKNLFVRAVQNVVADERAQRKAERAARRAAR
jgi:hypothetical protein